MYGSQVLDEVFLMLAAYILDGVAYLMDNAKLYGAFREYASNSVREAFQTVNATNQNVSHATVLKVCKDLKYG